MKTDQFYNKLKVQLEANTSFPGDYMYKFILPSSNSKLAELKQCFDDMRPKFSFKDSKTGKFTSITVMIFALDADQIIEGYRRATKIEGIISL